MSKPFLFVIRKEMDILRPFVIQVRREPELIEVRYVYRTKIKDQLEDFLILGFRVTKEDLSKRNDWKDYTQYGMHLKSYDIDYMYSCVRLIQESVDRGFTREVIEDLLHSHLPRYNTINRNGYLINISAASMTGRISSVEAHAIIPAYRLINWVQKLRSTPFTECCVNLAADPACEVEILSGDTYVPICNSSEIYKSLIHKDDKIKQQVWRPKLLLTELSSKHTQMGPQITIGVQLTREWYGDAVKAPAELYLESVNGYLPKTRLMLNENGYGIFTIVGLYLNVDDEIWCKVGFRYMKGIAEFKRTLTYRDY